jgi:sialic acid synthase SpsE
MMDSIRLSHDKAIDVNQRALLIAEISANHDRDINQALSLVDIAYEAGWDCLKLQTYTAESLTMLSNHPSTKLDPIWGAKNLYELYKKNAMPMDFHKPLFDRANELGLVPFTTVYDPRDLEYTEDLGCEIYKISSFEMTYDDLLIEMAQTSKPLILSTGMANIQEVDHALEVITQINCHGPLILLHCCSSYPAPIDEVNLCSIEYLNDRYSLPIGFSDHTLGSQVPIAAASIGAVVIEKHFTNDNNRDGPDHRFSATPEILKDIAEGVDTVFRARGQFRKASTKAEEKNKLVGRRSAFASRDLKIGTVLSTNDFRYIRPGSGVPANDRKSLLNAVLVRSVLKGHPITYDDLKV